MEGKNPAYRATSMISLSYARRRKINLQARAEVRRQAEMLQDLSPTEVDYYVNVKNI
jgi:hypothetical protein